MSLNEFVRANQLGRVERVWQNSIKTLEANDIFTVEDLVRPCSVVLSACEICLPQAKCDPAKLFAADDVRLSEGIAAYIRCLKAEAAKVMPKELDENGGEAPGPNAMEAACHCNRLCFMCDCFFFRRYLASSARKSQRMSSR